MDKDSQNLVAEPVKVVAPEEPKNKSSKGAMAAVIIFLFLALGGVAFGVYGMFFAQPKQGGQSTAGTDASQSTSQSAGQSTSQEGTTEGGTTSVVVNTIDNALAQTIADPYLVNFGAFDNIFDHDFDESAKLKIAFDNLGASEVVSVDMDTAWVITVPYNSLNKKYKDLFGSSKDIEKRNYDGGTKTNFEFVDEKFKAYVSGIGGTGGTMFSIVKEARYNNGNLEIDVYHDLAPWCGVAGSEDKGYCVESYSGSRDESVYNAVKNASDKIPVYRMTFVKDNGHYVLKNVEKQ